MPSNVEEVWNWIMGRGWKSLKVYVDKACIAMNEMLRVMVTPAQKKRRAKEALDVQWAVSWFE